MHDCGRFVWPSSNVEYWEKKIYRNVDRDKEHTEKLQADGWKVLTVWECELNKKSRDQTLIRLVSEIKAPG